MSITKEAVQDAIGGIIDVNTERDLAVTKSIKSIDVVKT